MPEARQTPPLTRAPNNEEKMKTLTWPEVIGRRLARNHLLDAVAPERLVDVVRDVGGIQAQVPAAAELGISARIPGITREDVRAAQWEKHTIVRTNGPRDTRHILPADELPLWTAALRAGLALRPKQNQRPGFSLTEIVTAMQELREALDGVILTREEIAEKMARNGGSRVRESLLSPWSELLDRAFYEGVIVHGPEEGSKSTFARADQWIGGWEEIDPDIALKEICRRYIATYGPVTHGDFARWFWIETSAARDLFQSIKNDLEEVKFERRKVWILASDAESGWEPIEGSLRLVPQYDCYILGSYPRDYIVSDDFKKFLSTLNHANYEGAVGHSLLLIDGVASGVWRRKPRGKRLEIKVSPTVSLSAGQRKQVEAEAERVGRFLGSEVMLTIGPPE
jgi:hypothetical protein